MTLKDTDKILEELNKIYCTAHASRLPEEYQAGIRTAILMIKNASTIDAEPVIRCKDCIYSWEGAEGEYFCHWDEDNQTWTEADGFCYRAEREDMREEKREEE